MSKATPLLVGISGGIGAGKTLICKIFSLLSIPIFNADDRAKYLMVHHLPLKKLIIDNFGASAYFEDGQLNRQYLADIVFADPDKTALINSLVHPAVAEDFKSWALSQQTKYVLKEAALLFETGSYKALDYTVHVAASEKIRIERIKSRDPKRSVDQIKQIINKQLTDEEKNKLASYIVSNDESSLVIPQVLKIHSHLMEVQ
ncbi:dephospho-CoA kinase [uncultured Cyclobacterium sp.]|uniref:dephospho-CoA kinase n=1 Tax=uncultured Cyclobacterium sp. TaxID=453820 RepID=UPI0030EB6D1A|tara:strand:+ start:116415 stop:117020 length:606 start_codon:yes stop_codon:yes gene_type:complete